jgi:hypothetical protein
MASVYSIHHLFNKTLQKRESNKSQRKKLETNGEADRQNDKHMHPVSGRRWAGTAH